MKSLRFAAPGWENLKLVDVAEDTEPGPGEIAVRVLGNSLNKGKNTLGIDKATWNTPRAKIGAMESLTRRGYGKWFCYGQLPR